MDMGLALADVAERDRATGPPQTAPSAVARVYENYLQVIVPDASSGATCLGSQGYAHLDRPGWLGRIGDQSSADRGGRPSTAGWTYSPTAYGMHSLRLAENSIAALVWSGGVPTPAIAELDAVRPLRIVDISGQAWRMSLSGYPYTLRPVPTCGYVPSGIRSIGVANLLLCRQGIPTDLVSATVQTLANDAPRLVPPYIRGLQYLDTPSMIQTGLGPTASGRSSCLRRKLPRLSGNSAGRPTKWPVAAARWPRESVDRARKSTPETPSSSLCRRSCRAIRELATGNGRPEHAVVEPASGNSGVGVANSTQSHGDPSPGFTAPWHSTSAR